MEGPGKNLKMVTLRFFNPLISKHIKNLFGAFINNFLSALKLIN